jgi:hypothetical protein
MLEAIKRRVSNAIGFRKYGLQSIPMHRDKTYTSEDLIEILDSILEDVEAAIEDTIKENINGKSVV